MKGIVFDILNDMVEEQFGLEAWDNLLDAVGSDGIYVATQSYPDEDLLALVAAASEATEIPAQDLVFEFGKYMVPKFYERYAGFFDAHERTKDFLLTVDEVIHVEVRKLFPDAGVPEFRYAEANGTLTMEYRSPRKLCALAEGLIEGSATHFGEVATIGHDVCMHNGADHCQLAVSFA